MNIIVAKFGGTSVSRKDSIKTIAQIVKKNSAYRSVVLVSAFVGVTDLLLSLTTRGNKDNIEKIRQLHLKIAKSFSQERHFKNKVTAYIDEQLSQVKKLVDKQKINNASIDKLMSYGEVMSSYIIAEALESSGITAQQIIASDIIVTDDNFGDAEFLINETTERVKKVLLPIIKKGVVPIITGFIGGTKLGKVTTLGRGGSDYSASILAFCLKAYEIQIWKDVDGVYTTDPRIVRSAKMISEISYKEASELAFFGAKVLHPRTIRPAISAKIPIRVLNTFHPNQVGTLISEKKTSKSSISAITFKRNVTLVNMYSTTMLLTHGFLARIFEIFAKQKIAINLVSTSEVSVSVTIDNDQNLPKAVRELEEFTSVVVSGGVSTLSLIGEETAAPQNLERMFFLLASKKIDVKMISLGATDINVSLVISSERLEEAVKILHNRLLLEKMVH